ncbi:MAG TPA: hypothetical protein VIS57_07835 [Xanthomonadales bacterium]
MGEKSQLQFEDDDLDTIDDFEDDLDFDESSEEPVVLHKKDTSAEQRRLAARREIERRNELKALNSALDEWDDLFDEDDL